MSQSIQQYQRWISEFIQKSGVESKPTDEDTVIFEKIHEQPTISCNNVTDLLCQHFKDLAITSRAVNDHICKKCHYEHTVSQLVTRDDDTIFYSSTNLYQPGW